MSLLADGYKQCGEVFTVPLLHKKITFLIGPHVSPHFFRATDDQLSQTEVGNFIWHEHHQLSAVQPSCRGHSVRV